MSAHLQSIARLSYIPDGDVNTPIVYDADNPFLPAKKLQLPVGASMVGVAICHDRFPGGYQTRELNAYIFSEIALYSD